MRSLAILALTAAVTASAEESPVQLVPIPADVLRECAEQGGCVMVSRQRLVEMLAEAVERRRMEMMRQCGRGS